jgi:hypothetical protein
LRSESRLTVIASIVRLWRRFAAFTSIYVTEISVAGPKQVAGDM